MKQDEQNVAWHDMKETVQSLDTSAAASNVSIANCPFCKSIQPKLPALATVE